MTDLSTRAQRYRRYLEGVVGIPATEGNRVDVLRNGVEIFPAMLDAIGEARYTVDLLTFIYWDGRIGERFATALARRAREGVRVRVLLDALGARRINHDWLDMMAEAGVQIEWFRPLAKGRVWKLHNRTHRKVLICDEQVAFTGGVGIADEWDGDAGGPGEWRDTHFRIAGPAVDGLRSAFIDNWLETGRPIWDDGIDRFPEQEHCGSTVAQTVRGESETGSSDITTLVHTLLRTVEHRLRVVTAYFSPHPHTLELLASCAERGVEVEVLLPGPYADKRFVQLTSEDAYQRLLDAGVRIACFQPSMLHAKIMLVDDTVACIGSANFNARSLEFDEEVDVVLFDPAVIGVLDEHFDEDWGRSEEIDPARWRRRNLAQRGKERVMSAAAWFI